MTWHGSNVNEARALLQQQEGHGPTVSSRLGLIVYMPNSFSLSFAYARLPSHFIFPASVTQLFLHPPSSSVSLDPFLFFFIVMSNYMHHGRILGPPKSVAFFTLELFDYTLRCIVHTKMMNDEFKLNLYDFLSSVLHKSRYFEDVNVGN